MDHCEKLGQWFPPLSTLVPIVVIVIIAVTVSRTSHITSHHWAIIHFKRMHPIIKTRHRLSSSTRESTLSIWEHVIIIILVEPRMEHLIILTMSHVLIHHH